MIVESRNVVLRSTLFAILSISVLHSGFAEDIWTRDLDKQRPSQRPALEARYNASSRDAFLIEAERYSIQLDLRNADRHAISKMNASGQTLFHHGHFTIQDTNGKVWNSLNTGRPSRINLYRRGPYYNEIHWLDIAFTDRKGKTLPVRGELMVTVGFPVTTSTVTVPDVPELP